jgi:hypothetical protein
MRAVRPFGCILQKRCRKVLRRRCTDKIDQMSKEFEEKKENIMHWGGLKKGHNGDGWDLEHFS